MANVIHLNEVEDIKQLKQKLPETQKYMTGIDIQKYSGVITLTEDPVAYQKRMRNEWN